MAKKPTIRLDYEVESHDKYPIDDLPPNSEFEFELPPLEKSFRESVAQSGVIKTVICTTYRNKKYMIDGKRRLAAARHMIAEIEENPDYQFAQRGLKSIDHLKTIPVRMFKGVSPHQQAFWGIVLNKERSENILSDYHNLKALEKNQRWEELAIYISLESNKMKKLLKLDNLVDQDTIFKAYGEKKIAKSSMFDMAKLEAQRQQHLLAILKEKGKIVGKDIKDVKTARTAKALANIPYPKDPVNTMDYIVFSDGKAFGPFTEFPEALTESHKHTGSAVYKKVG